MAALEVMGLTKRYGRYLAVDDVSLTVERGQLFGLLGPNGSGKTTTLRCSLGLLAADRGRISLLGVPSRSLHRTDGRVAVVFDGPTLVPNLTCEQNLAYARRLLGHGGGRPAKEALELVGIPHLGSQRAGSLSLGQGRRLSIARALIGRPELLVLDEPLSGLDAVGVRSMLAMFSRLAGEGLTLVLSSHRLHELERIVSHVAVLLGGRVVTQGALHEVLAGDGQRLLVRTPRRDDALAALADRHGLTCLADPVEPDLLRIDGADSGEAIARALVGADVPIHALQPERRNLASLFDDLVDAHLREGGEVPA